MSDTIDLTDALNFVSQADHAELDAIMSAWKLRRTQLGHLQLAQLKPGDMVELHGLSPKYLNGVRATVQRLSGTKVIVGFDPDDFSAMRARQRFGTSCTVPTTAVRPVQVGA
jgi:hypothetical protein